MNFKEQLLNMNALDYVRKQMEDDSRFSELTLEEKYDTLTIAIDCIKLYLDGLALEIMSTPSNKLIH